MGDPLSKRKQDKIPAIEVRRHQVKVMLNDDELQRLDEHRGRYKKAEVIRLLILAKMPRPVPAINEKMVFELSRSLGNLATVAKFLRTGEPDKTLVEDAIYQVRQVMKSLKTGGDS